MMQCAEVYLRQDGYFVQSYSLAISGVWIGGRPAFKLPNDVEADSLVDAIREALAASQHGVEHPKDWNAIKHLLPEMAGEKSWGGFMKKARSVSVESEYGMIKFVPSTNLGPREGYTPIELPVVVPEDSDPERIFAALMESFGRCR